MSAAGHLLSLLTTAFFLGHVCGQSSITRCSSQLRYGGMCVDTRQGCPTGTYKYTAYSNFLGCNRVDQICCAFEATSSRQSNPSAPVNPTSPQLCGMASGVLGSRILQGRITGPCDWPFVVSIRGLIRDRTSLTYDNTLHTCGGVLIGNNWVLTSPFCVLSAGTSAALAPQNILVVAAEYNVSTIDIDPLTGSQQEQLLTVERAFIHPAYQYTDIQNIVPLTDDVAINSNAVALLKLRSSINGRCNGVACLPTPEEAARACAPYDNCVITGWGFATEIISQDQLVTTLLMGQNRLTSRVACDFLTNRLGLQQSRPAGTTCQGPLGRVTDNCMGDEGGAVLCNTNGRNWVVRGILPFNICVNNQYNMFLTDVAPYLQWITDTMAFN